MINNGIIQRIHSPKRAILIPMSQWKWSHAMKGSGDILCHSQCNKAILTTLVNSVECKRIEVLANYVSKSDGCFFQFGSKKYLIQIIFSYCTIAMLHHSHVLCNCSSIRVQSRPSITECIQSNEFFSFIVVHEMELSQSALLCNHQYLVGGTTKENQEPKRDWQKLWQRIMNTTQTDYMSICFTFSFAIVSNDSACMEILIINN